MLGPDSPYAAHFTKDSSSILCQLQSVIFFVITSHFTCKMHDYELDSPAVHCKWTCLFIQEFIFWLQLIFNAADFWVKYFDALYK